MKQLLVLAVLVFGATFANACWFCDQSTNYLYCKSIQSAGCRCFGGGDGCTWCGQCVGGRCNIQCPGGIKTGKPSSVETALRSWPWIKDQELARNIGASSPVLGKLIEMDQKHLNAGQCSVSSVRGGMFRLAPKSQHVAEWYSVVNQNKIRYLVYKGYGSQPRELVLTKDRWQVLQHKRIVTEGSYVQAAK